jgi:CheY-like chemotaxis protein
METAMKILIADDDPNKMRQLKSFVMQEFVDAEILERNTFNSALRCAMLDEPTVILLDMTMPTFDVGGKETGGYERRYAGFEVLRRLKRRRKARRVIIVTQFERFGEGADQMTLEQLKEQLATQYPESYIVTVYYQASDAQWRDDLRVALDMSIERAIE